MEFSVGSALGTSFRVWFRNFLPFTLLNALIHLPFLAWAATILRGAPSMEKAHELQRFAMIAGLSGLLLQMFLVSTVTYGVVMELRGQHAGMGANLRVGVSRLFPALGVTLLMILCIGLGFFALIVGAIVVYVILYVSVPASVIERPGITGALKRSAELTRGYRLQIFGLLLVVFIISFVIGKGIENAYIKPNLEPSEAMSAVRHYVFANSIFEIISGVFGAVLMAVTYAQLRFSKDGASVDELARVFD
jgi:hypothetical protein